MAPLHLSHFLIVGAGAAGLMTARELARVGKKVTILEARDRCGGRIYLLSAQEFGYAAEGGAEFIHGAAPVIRAFEISGRAWHPVRVLSAPPRSLVLTEISRFSPNSPECAGLFSEILSLQRRS
jgi:phytoene dehydrogenase-like protein